VKQLQLNSRGLGVGCMVGTGTGDWSGVATTPGTLVSCDGMPGRIGTEGCVSGGGPGGGAGTCASATPASATSASAITIARRALEEELEQAPEMAVEKTLIAKEISSRKNSSNATQVLLVPARALPARRPSAQL
jgi:hypothetical protein